MNALTFDLVDRPPTPDRLSFTVYGVAAPQGSKDRTRWGVRENNPDTKPWRAEVRSAAVEAMAGAPLLMHPVEVQILFYFPHLKGHYRSGAHADELKANAPLYCTGRKDLDKLQRTVGDALTGTVVRDDVQIAHWDSWKLYGEPARVEITVRLLPAARDTP